MLNLINLNKQQFDAVTIHNGPILVVAGAGTGKTRVLTTRIVYLIEELHFNPNKILAITFTNKASNEMKTRINNMLDNIYVP
jgi:DNA helicase-2/ATP-dependent DNA helicase PcrA